MVKLSGLKLPASWAGIGQHPLFLKGKRHLPLIAGGFFGLLFLLLGIRGWRQYHRKKAVTTGDPTEKPFVRLADFSDVETLFLSLFKMKLGAPASAPTEIEKTPQKGSGPPIAACQTKS